ncbi:MAG: ATP-binding protein [Candidatus Limivivens sp.]|nr:ATP-binding protein [Candidatus Limivivens sp.]
MALKNSQYDEIMREYHRRQLDNKRTLDRRTAEVSAKLPLLEELNHQIASLSVSCARKYLGGDDSALTTLQDDIDTLAGMRRSLLEEAGYPGDYLDMHYTCPDCKDTGYIGSEKCHCFRQAVIDLLYTQSNIREALKTENFGTFSFDYYSDDVKNPSTGLGALTAMKKLVAECRDFLAHFDDTFDNFFFYGDTGVGKTFLSHCIAKELIDTAHSVIYFTAFELFDLFSKTTFSRGDELEELQQMHSYIFDCDLLIIDDLGTELTNSFVASQLFLCINERLLRRRSTIISTNLAMDVFRDTYSERVFSRISSGYKMRKLIGDDIRIKKKLARLAH